MVTPIMVFAVALLGALSVTELVRVAAVRLRAVDQPGGRRMHQRPTPRLGGIGIAWGFGCGLAFMAALSGQTGPFAGTGTELLALLLAAGLMGVVGHADDRWSLSSTPKLVACIVASLILWSGGWRAESVGLPGIGEWTLGIWSLPVTIAWVVFVTNAMNLIDGLDGLAGGVALLACIGYLLLPGLGATERMVAISLAGALLGFLWFNLHPALIFMGDAGSLFAGVVVAALALHPPNGVTEGWFPVMPMLLLVVPLADTSHAIGRRLLSGARQASSLMEFLHTAPRRMFTADRGHVHHRLQAAGYSPRRAAAILWAAASSFVVMAASFARDGRWGVAVAVAVFSAWSWVGWRVSLRLARSPITPSLSPVVATSASEVEPARESTRAA